MSDNEILDDSYPPRKLEKQCEIFMDNNGGVIVRFIIDLKKDYTPYFMAFIKALGLKDGDECKGYEYINWITGKHEEFRKKMGLDKYTLYTKEQEKMFLKFINGSR